MSNEATARLEDRFWVNVQKTKTCWLWIGRRSGRGYGSLFDKGVNRAAHKVSLEIVGRPVPDGLLADHICKNRLCVRPSHLRAVTPKQNTLENSNAPTAINKRKTHCPQGHEYTPDNTSMRRGKRHCRTCQRRWTAAYDKRRRSTGQNAALSGEKEGQ